MQKLAGQDLNGTAFSNQSKMRVTANTPRFAASVAVLARYLSNQHPTDLYIARAAGHREEVGEMTIELRFSRELQSKGIKRKRWR